MREAGPSSLCPCVLPGELRLSFQQAVRYQDDALACTGIMGQEEKALFACCVYIAQESRKQRCPRPVVMELLWSRAAASVHCSAQTN